MSFYSSDKQQPNKFLLAIYLKLFSVVRVEVVWMTPFNWINGRHVGMKELSFNVENGQKEKEAKYWHKTFTYFKLFAVVSDKAMWVTPYDWINGR